MKNSNTDQIGRSVHGMDPTHLMFPVEADVCAASVDLPNLTTTLILVMR
jgi:hypothetical protein